jgi:hypothetical protein
MTQIAPNPFDYAAAAELYVSQGKWGSSSVRYKRFDAAAWAIRHAIEILPSSQLSAAVLEVAERRYDRAMIQKLYDSHSYPLPRLNDGSDSQ